MISNKENDADCDPETDKDCEPATGDDSIGREVGEAIKNMDKYGDVLDDIYDNDGKNMDDIIDGKDQ